MILTIHREAAFLGSAIAAFDNPKYSVIRELYHHTFR